MERSLSTAVFLPFLSNQARRMSPRAPPAPRPKKRPGSKLHQRRCPRRPETRSQLFPSAANPAVGPSEYCSAGKTGCPGHIHWPRCQPGAYLFGIQRPNIDTLLLGIKGVWFGGSTFRWDFTHPPVAGRRPTSMSIDVPPADSTAAATDGPPKPTTITPEQNSQILGRFAQL